MAYLILILLLLLPFVSTNDELNKTNGQTNKRLDKIVPVNVTAAVSVVAKQLPARPYGRSVGDAIALGAFQNVDKDCSDFNPQKEALRDAKTALAINEKLFTAGGYGLIAAGEAADVVPLFGKAAAAPLKTAGNGLLAAGALMGAAGLGIEVETQELEYMKCARQQSKQEFDEFKKGFDELKNDFGKFKNTMSKQFGVVFKKFDELKNQFKTGVNEIKANIKNYHKELINVIEDLDDERAVRDYKSKMVPIAALKEEFRSYAKFPNQGARLDLFHICKENKPLNILIALKEVHVMDVLTIKATKHYPLLRNMCARIHTEVMEIAQIAIACFATTTGAPKSKEALADRENVIAEIVGSIRNEMRTMLIPAKNNAIADINANFSNVPCNRETESPCLVNYAIMYNYLRKVHSWAKWYVACDYIRDWTQVELGKSVFGETTYITPIKSVGCCQSAYMWCENNYEHDNVRQKMAQAFRKINKLQQFSSSFDCGSANSTLESIKILLKGFSKEFLSGVMIEQGDWKPNELVDPTYTYDNVVGGFCTNNRTTSDWWKHTVHGFFYTICF